MSHRFELKAIPLIRPVLTGILFSLSERTSLAQNQIASIPGLATHCLTGPLSIGHNNLMALRIHAGEPIPTQLQIENPETPRLVNLVPLNHSAISIFELSRAPECATQLDRALQQSRTTLQPSQSPRLESWVPGTNAQRRYCGIEVNPEQLCASTVATPETALVDTRVWPIQNLPPLRLYNPINEILNHVRSQIPDSFWLQYSFITEAPLPEFRSPSTGSEIIQYQRPRQNIPYREYTLFSRRKILAISARLQPLENLYRDRNHSNGETRIPLTITELQNNLAEYFADSNLPARNPETIRIVQNSSSSIFEFITNQKNQLTEFAASTEGSTFSNQLNPIMARITNDLFSESRIDQFTRKSALWWTLRSFDLLTSCQKNPQNQYFRSTEIRQQSALRQSESQSCRRMIQSQYSRVIDPSITSIFPHQIYDREHVIYRIIGSRRERAEYYTRIWTYWAQSNEINKRRQLQAHDWNHFLKEAKLAIEELAHSQVITWLGPQPMNALDRVALQAELSALRDLIERSSLDIHENLSNTQAIYVINIGQIWQQYRSALNLRLPNPVTDQDLSSFLQQLTPSSAESETLLAPNLEATAMSRIIHALEISSLLLTNTSTHESSICRFWSTQMQSPQSRRRFRISFDLMNTRQILRKMPDGCSKVTILLYQLMESPDPNAERFRNLLRSQFRILCPVRANGDFSPLIGCLLEKLTSSQAYRGQSVVWSAIFIQAPPWNEVAWNVLFHAFRPQHEALQSSTDPALETEKQQWHRLMRNITTHIGNALFDKMNPLDSTPLTQSTLNYNCLLSIIELAPISAGNSRSQITTVIDGLLDRLPACSRQERPVARQLLFDISQTQASRENEYAEFSLYQSPPMISVPDLLKRYRKIKQLTAFTRGTELEAAAIQWSTRWNNWLRITNEFSNQPTIRRARTRWQDTLNTSRNGP